MIQLVGLTVPYMHLSLKRALEGIARAGYTAVGVGWSHEGQDVLGLDPQGEGVRRCLDLCERLGLEPVIVGRGNPGPSVPPEVAWRGRIDVARAMGAQVVQAAGVNRYRRFPTEPLAAADFWAAHRRFVRLMKDVGAHALASGVTVTLKPHTGNTATAAHLRRTLAEIGSPGIKACYDPGNVRYYEGVTPETDFSLIADETVSMVAKDHRGGRAEPTFPVPGEGDINWTKIFSTARGAQQLRFVAVERVSSRGEQLTPEDIDERMARARRFLQSHTEVL